MRVGRCFCPKSNVFSPSAILPARRGAVSSNLPPPSHELTFPSSCKQKQSLHLERWHLEQSYSRHGLPTGTTPSEAGGAHAQRGKERPSLASISIAERGHQLYVSRCEGLQLPASSVLLACMPTRVGTHSLLIKLVIGDLEEFVDPWTAFASVESK